MLSLLGIKQLVVVLNKMDAVDYSQEVFQDMAGQMKDLLKQLTLDQLAIIPASALEGDNIVNRSEHMPWHEGPTVIEALDLLTPTVTDESLPLRLCVQDVYEIDGQRIAAGRLASGSIRTAQKVCLCPPGNEVEVAGLRKFEGPIDSAAAGESIGFQLAGDGQVRRGQILCDPGSLPASTRSLIASVFWMSPEPLKKGQRIALRLGTQEIDCEVREIANRMDSGNLRIIEEQADGLGNTEVAEVTLQADEPIHYDGFARIAEMGRLVLMRKADIVAGGILT